MIKSSLVFDALLLASVCYFVLASPAQAYFHLGSGTYVLQVVVLIGAVFWLSANQNFVKTAWKKITNSGSKELDDNTSAHAAESDSGKR
jgi:hypothetical protein